MAKRLKHIHNNIEHVFFHQDEFGIDWGRDKSTNMLFRENRIYSYSSEIGIADFDKKVLYFRDGSYSNSTAKHQIAIKYAIPGGWRVFTWLKWHSFPYVHLFVDERVEVLKEQKNKLYYNKIWNDYSYDKFLKEVTELSEYTGNTELLTKFLEDSKPYVWTDEDRKHASIKEWVNEKQLLGSWKDKVRAYEDVAFRLEFFDKQVEMLKKNKLKKEKSLETLKKDFDEYIAKDLLKWYNGETVYFGYYIPPKFHKILRDYSFNIHLRISPKDPKVVDTSKGVDIPLIECKVLYKKFRKCIETNTEWHTNGETYRISKYQLEKIYKDGEHWYLHSGCHLIRDVEIEEFIDRFNLQEWRQ